MTSLTYASTRYQQHRSCYLTPTPREELSDSQCTDSGSTGATGLARAPLSSLILTMAQCLWGSSPAVHDSEVAPADCFLSAVYSLVLSLPTTLHCHLLCRRNCRTLVWHVWEAATYSIQSTIKSMIPPETAKQWIRALKSPYRKPKKIQPATSL